MDEIPYGLSMIEFGGPKVGKSTLGDTTPAPRLILDAEGGSRFTPSRKITWDPLRAPVPVPDGTWDTVVVHARAFKTVQTVFSILDGGKHPFRSVTLDSISEMQQRAVDSMVGPNKMERDNWGELLRVMSELIRSFRDLVTHPVKPLDAVVFIAMAKQDKDTKIWKPYAQGQLATTLPYYVDVCAYLAIIPATETTEKVRRLFIDPIAGFETGERIGGHLGPWIDNANVSDMITRVRTAIAHTSEQGSH